MATGSDQEDLEAISQDNYPPMKKRKKDNCSNCKNNGCYVDCCMGVTVAVAVCVFVGLLVLLIAWVSPKPKCSCPTTNASATTNTTAATNTTSRTVGSSDSTRSAPVQANSLWEQCHQLANSRHECLGPCQNPVGMVLTTTKGPQEVPSTTQPRTLIDPSPVMGFRLNRSLLPVHYNLELTPRMYPGDDFQFDGSVEIFITCEQRTGVIVLHAKNVTIDSGSVSLRSSETNSVVQVVQVVTDESRDFAHLYTAESLTPDSKYVLKMSFTGTLKQPTQSGLYRAEYVDADHKLKYLVVSQFAPAHARRAFPCFDEPSFKATFNVTLVRRSNYTALSNMPLRKTEDRNSTWKADIFEQTPLMSTYALAIVLCQFEYRETLTSRGTKIRLWAPPRYVGYVDFALTVSVPILETLETWTGLKYPLPKIDQVAVGYLASRAMASWGLLTYRADALLVNPNHSSTADRLQVAYTISRQLVKQWFGNLVTISWWDDVFLNEAFASYLGLYVGLNSSIPGLKVGQVFNRQVEKIMQADSRGWSQPVRRNDREPPERMSDVYSNTAADKGAAILRMVDHFLGGRTFQGGVRRYLRENAYGTVTRDDLYRALNTQAEEDGVTTWGNTTSLASILDTWVNQRNYPIVHVASLPNGTLLAYQDPFVLPNARPTRNPLPSHVGFRWDVPLTFADLSDLEGNGTSPNLTWIYWETAVTSVDNQRGLRLVNVFRQGFYRVAYGREFWNGIMDQLLSNYTVIPVENRAEILDDAFALASSGQMAEVEALLTTRYLKNENQYAPWDAGLNDRLPVYEKLLSRSSTYDLLNNYILDLVLPSYERLGWNSSDAEEYTDIFLRSLILEQVCKRDYKPCVDQALQLFREFKNDPKNNAITPEVRKIVFCSAMAHGNQEDFNFMKTRFLESYEKTDDHLVSEVQDIFDGLTCVRDQDKINQAIDMAQSINLYLFMLRLAEQPAAEEAIWKYLNDNWDSLHQSPLVAGGQHILDILTDRFATFGDLSLLMAFLSGHRQDLPVGLDDTLIEKVRWNIAWMKVNQKPIREWLRLVGSHG